ncbi:GNAT family N-acetyltransferase [Candidatus Wolfebacteria bacterium]|nr:GNAT family N-acetyltransferase [Candidatus Wolfebacteria bacterium]
MILRGQKINLRPLKISDAEFIFKHANNRKISRYTDILYPLKISEIKKYIRKSIKELKIKKSFIFGIEIKGRDEIIGIVSLADINYKNKSVELEYWVSPKYWRKGIAAESLKLILNFAFKKLKLNRVFAKTLPENINSINLLKKIGFVHEGTLRKSLFERGKFNDIFVFSILKNEL